MLVQSPVAPQKARLVCGSTQVPPQSRRPDWQVRAQAPLLQTWPAEQTVPSLLPPPTLVQSPVAPQWPLSVSGSTQTPPQLTLPVGQEVAQAPPVQMLPAGQTAPSLLPPPTLEQSPVAPQKVRLVLGSTQVPPQLTRPDWQDSWQVDPLQTWPAGQVAPALPAPATPQPVVAPQYWRLVVGSMQVPLQLTRPV